MKKIILAFLLLFSVGIFAQSLSDYQYVIVPLRYEFMKSDNEYRLSTITKFNLEKIGFQAFYNDNNLPKEIISNACSVLKVEALSVGSFMGTSLIIVFRDCQNNIVYQSEIGKSKEKEYAKAFPDALTKAFVSVSYQNYSYQPVTKKTSKPIFATSEITFVNTVLVNENALKAIPIAGGFNLVDRMQQIVFKLTSAGKNDFYLAQKGTLSGVVFLKGADWFFEYILADNLISEKVEIQF
jgi:hypothetical protein